MARLFVLCDGTWNTEDPDSDGKRTRTNVVKFGEALATLDDRSAPQHAQYFRGVGTGGSPWERLAGGAFGSGLEENVQDAYEWLARNYKDGDSIHLIGFSRGAFTARSVGGMIGRCGLIDLLPASGVSREQGREEVAACFRMYRMDRGTPGSEPPAEMKRAVRIHFIGVWDTVGARGIPGEFGTIGMLDDRKYGFHDTELSESVEHARHALALDERRQTFSPTLWTRQWPGQTVKQVWFPGVHGDVGGGYPETDLSDGPLAWMIEEARALGIGFKKDVCDGWVGRPDGQLHDSVTGIFRRLRQRPRAAPRIHQGTDVHDSVLARSAAFVNAGRGYWSHRELVDTAECDVPANDPWHFTGIYLEKDKTYHFTASGEWSDKDIRCDPAGRVIVGPLLQRVVRETVGGIDAVQRWAGDALNLQLARREDAFPWFCLVGAIANGACENGEHETFRIGDEATFAPKASGYLFCFANDDWHMYENNSGSVRMTVRLEAATGAEPALATVGP